MSRDDRPKQFLALTADQTMFALTVMRVADPARFAPPIIVAGERHGALIERELGDIGVAPAAVILEPCARNTAPAIAIAALVSRPKAALLVMPSDHVITDPAAFEAAIAAAMPMLEDGWMVTFGVTPTAPETGYGYIAVGEALAPGVHRVSRFVEKPERARAQAMVAAGDHVWNAGIFLFRADAYLQALATHAPAMFAAVQAAAASATLDGIIIRPEPGAFAAAPADSIDYAVMEKAARVAVVPVSMGWSDVGSWDALYDFGSVAAGGGIAIDTQNCLVRSDSVRIHTIGVSDLVIVASGNDVIIVPRGHSQRVKEIVDALKAR